LVLKHHRHHAWRRVLLHTLQQPVHKFAAPTRHLFFSQLAIFLLFGVALAVFPALP
jgi:hypothetical protein